MQPGRIQALRICLDALVARYDAAPALALDPLAVPRAYSDPWDQEAAAWVAAHLAYGRVSPMLSAIRRALAPLGSRPAQWLRSHPSHEVEALLEEALAGWVWRFHTREDLIQWLLAWKTLDQDSNHLGVAPHLEGGPLDSRLSALIQRLRRELPPTPGLRFTLPDPAAGSACKRWRMHLRWMIRTEWPDLGLWTQLDAQELIIPLDTHVARFASLLGLTQRQTQDGKMAAEITASLRLVEQSDPLRYDFALAHLGILGDCTRKGPAQFCDTCPLETVCLGTQKQRSSLP